MTTPRGRLIAELTLLTLAALWATAPLLQHSTNADLKLAGNEQEFLTSHLHTAAQSLHATGRIPLWQPYLGDGRPLIESPFSAVMNPFSAGPALLTGDGVSGVKLSVALYALLAVYGGWFCGWAFRLGGIGRVLLGLLLLGKGNMAAMFGIGHVQLGVAQVYMPWIIGAAYRLLRGDQARWLVALLGMAFALQFLAGNVWHVLPTLIAVSVLTLAYATAWRGLARLASASVITLGLSAVVLLPLMVNQPYIGGAADPVTGGDRSMPAQVALRQMVTAEVLVTAPELGLAVSEAETRYNYTLPLWFAALMLVVLPPIPGWLYRARLPDERRVWVVGGALFVFFTLWGVGGVAPFRWAYDTLPGLDRWRFVGRAFGMGTFWLALLVALRVDRLGAALWAREQLSRRVRQGLVAAVGITALLAGGQVTAHTWREWVRLVPATPANAACLDWLRANTPVSPLVEVAQVNYNTVYGFLDRNLRQQTTAPSYRPLPVASVRWNETARRPRFFMPTHPRAVPALQANGYVPVTDAPSYADGLPCLWEYAAALPYAFVIRADAPTDGNTTPPGVYPVERAYTHSERVTLRADGLGGVAGLAVAQQVAYPGWQAYVDGQSVPLEPVGGWIGARLPLSTDTHTVTFVYRPRWVTVGGAITLLTALGVALYLLRLDAWRR